MKKAEYVYDGVFSSHMLDFIRQKRSYGYLYHEGGYILKRFEDFCKKNFPDCREISKEIGLKWAELFPNERGAAQMNRIAVIREFGKYLNSIGISAYVIPPNFNMRPHRPEPYVYSRDQLAALFRAADEYSYKSCSPASHLVVSVIFRLIYCCGLRPVEARRIQVKDVNLDTGEIKILESKGHKDRIVVMSDDMRYLARKYQEQVTMCFPKRTYFFPERFGEGMYSNEWMKRVFTDLLIKADIPKVARQSPRAYDLRHTFATHRLYQWLQEGENVNACLAYLSEYMGHANITDTAYYIHLVPEFYPQMAELGFQIPARLLPVVPS